MKCLGSRIAFSSQGDLQNHPPIEIRLKIFVKFCRLVRARVAAFFDTLPWKMMSLVKKMVAICGSCWPNTPLHCRFSICIRDKAYLMSWNTW